jgi:hypothetical protein
LFALEISARANAQIFPWPATVAIAPPREISVKPIKRRENGELSAGYQASRIGNFHGRNGDRSMTQGKHSKVTTGGISAPVFVRAYNQPRPSLGSSHALLLLSCP